MLTQATLCALALAPIAAPQQPKGRGPLTPPPGMVLIEGGTTKIGSTEKEILGLAAMDELLFLPTVCETPQHDVKVDEFFLGVSEVTNEQYYAFVKATGYHVPEHWAGKLIEEQQRLYVKDLEDRIRQAKEKGEPLPERRKFEPSEWWRRHAADHKEEGKDWELPKGKETLPVVYVDYQDAQAYARWAGVRLMTEFEFQRAGRGKDARLYPWGDTFDPKKALTTATRAGAPTPAGALPGGATAQGVYDLSGNIWEWTSSPFSPFPGWKVLKLEGKDKRTIDGLVAWDENKRVAVGGSFQNDGVVARLTTRRPSERGQSTDSLGFRCAASVVSGRDMAETVMHQDVPPDMRPMDVEYDISRLIATDRWRSSPGSALLPPDENGERKPLPGYSVIEGYDYVLFVPVVEMDVTSIKQLNDLSAQTGPVAMGVLSLTLDATEPALKRGSYFVAYLAKQTEDPAASEKPAKPAKPGKPEKGAKGSFLPQEPGAQEPGAQEPEAQEQPAYELPEGIDRKKDNLLFYSPDDKPVAALPIENIEFTRPKDPRVVAGPGKKVVLRPAANGQLEPVDVPVDQVILSVNTWVRVRDKGFSYDILLRFESGALGEGWRR